MTVYILCFILLALASVTKSRVLQNLSIFFILFVSMFRADSVGLDTFNYLNLSGYEGTGFKAFEFVFLFLKNLVPILGNHITIYAFSVIQIFCIVKSCKRFNVDPALSLLFFLLFGYFNLSLNISRQFTAVCLLLNGYSFLQYDDKSKYRFFLFAIIAGGFHVSAYLFSLLFFLRKINISKIKPIVYIVALVLIKVVFSAVLMSKFEEWTKAFVLLEGMEGYSSYFEQAEVMGTASFGGMVISYMIFFLKLYVLIYLIKNNIVDKNSTINVIPILFFLSILVDLFFEGLYGNLNRTRHYVDIINIVAFACYFINSKSSMKHVIMGLTVLFYGYMLYNSMVHFGAVGTYPYKFSF